MNLTITIAGSFSDELDDGDLAELKEDLEEELRVFWNGSGVVVEVVRG